TSRSRYLHFLMSLRFLKGGEYLTLTYKTLIAYFMNYRVKSDHHVEFDIVFHGFLPNDTSADNVAPVVSINGPYHGTIGYPIQFSSKGSNDPDGTIASYHWDFGDGTTSQDANPAHVYSKTGTFKVALKVTDNQGKSNEKTTTSQ
ncbi:PKD domain-containing protein, partial [Paenibacillus sp. MZ04-78.2]|uniref:PKD domain-containing protein n=1 Tax=Paenibacillus sp. MZ04-78.2 TaxID=2962034 RepID=UPI0020B75598